MYRYMYIHNMCVMHVCIGMCVYTYIYIYIYIYMHCMYVCMDWATAYSYATQCWCLL